MKKDLTYLHTMIGFLIIIAFWTIPPITPITPIGMKSVGIFLGMVYLWSTVDTLWPSILGLTLIGISGYAGEGFSGFTKVISTAIGHPVVLQTLFVIVLFGALDQCGSSKYIAQWFITRKIFKGRPYVFILIFYVACWALSIISAITALIILWPIALRIVESLKITKQDKLWNYFFMGMFLTITVGQIIFPFLGAPLSIIGTFETMTHGKYIINSAAYMVYIIIMTSLVISIYLTVLKFIIRPDVSKLKNVDPEMVRKELNLPDMNFQQKAYLFMVPCYLIMMLVPMFLPKDILFVALMNSWGALGIGIFFILVFSVLRFNGEPMLNFKEVAYSQFSWGLFFLIAAAIYGGSTLSDPATGVTGFLVEKLNPLLGGCSELAFVAILFTFALIITNFANNAAMAILLMPIIITFSEQLSINPIPVAMGVTSMVFVAMLTPSASPHASMLFGRTDIYASKDILRIGFPMCIAVLILYILVGYPIAKLLFI
ncbi:SLC13 family permease [Desulfotomaculum sp. 1211_IL3151]|uniref:SLC13 family permease n=1 Tax=Desulfotomaculum sp. 1211_IL3151 TaxID=3084055 RepID=UPI002FDA168C